MFPEQLLGIVLGFMSIQPSEFAKASTALALAKFLSDLQTNIRLINDQLKAFLIIALPALIIIPQPDPGSALVYAAFFFPLYREGLAPMYLIIGASSILLFVLTLFFSATVVVVIIALFLILYLFIRRKKKPKYLMWFGTFLIIAGYCFSGKLHF